MASCTHVPHTLEKRTGRTWIAQQDERTALWFPTKTHARTMGCVDGCVVCADGWCAWTRHSAQGLRILAQKKLTFSTVVGLCGTQKVKVGLPTQLLGNIAKDRVETYTVTLSCIRPQHPNYCQPYLDPIKPTYLGRVPYYSLLIQVLKKVGYLGLGYTLKTCK